MKHKLDVTINELRLKSIRKIVKRINTWSDEVKSYSDDALKQKTIEFKERLASGVDTLDTYCYLKLMQWHVKRAGEY
ncbi:Protein export cytoplasm protein SecA2 ATPase RNA helicase [Staphylococcus aureus]|nr:Protein export cytoplasm protein SecA2 ATPase RNA helicase [Staphylococcus aureus]